LVLFGVAGLTFLGTGGVPLLRRRRAGKGKPGRQELTPGRADPPVRAPVTAGKASRRAAAPAADDELKDVEEILRKHGIS
jgi:hypothetical protein